jgi:nicotinate phosphoribosyltransferase
MEGVAKKSKDKQSVGGRKWAMRRLSDKGVAQAEVIGIGEAPGADHNDRPLMIELVRDGEVVDHQDIHEARARHHASRAELPRAATQLSRGEAVIPTIYEGD